METKKIETAPISQLIELEEKCRVAMLGQEPETRMQIRIVHDEVKKELRRRKMNHGSRV